MRLLIWKMVVVERGRDSQRCRSQEEENYKSGSASIWDMGDEVLLRISHQDERHGSDEYEMLVSEWILLSRRIQGYRYRK